MIASENEAAQRDAARTRELDAAKKLADAERQRAEEGVKSAHRLRRRSILSTSIGALAVILAVFSVIAWQRSVANAANLQSLNLANAAVQANNSGRGDLALALAMEAVKGNKPPVDALKALRAIASSPATRAILSGNNLSVRVVAISPDAKIAFSGSCSRLDDQGACTAGELILWDLGEFKEIHRWSAHTGWVTAVAFSPDGLMLVSGADDGSLVSWDLNGNEIGQYVGQMGGITDIAIVDSINGLLSSSSDGSLILWGLHSRKILQRYENPIIPINSIAVASSKMIAVSAQQDGSLRLWNLLDAQPLSLYEHQGSGINSVAISLDGGRILFTNQVVPDLSLRMIDSQSGEIIGQYKFNCIPGDIAPNPEFSSAYIACQKEIYQVDLGKMEAQRSYLESSAFINAITISQDRTLGLSAMEDGSIRVWNLGEQLDYHIEYIPADKLNAIATTRNNYYLLVNDAQINGIEQPALWDFITHATVRTYNGFSGSISPGAIAISPGNGFIAVAGWSIDPADPTTKSSTIAIWKYSIRYLQCRFAEFSAPGRALAFSPDSRYLLAGSQDPSTGLGQLMLLDVNDCRPLHEFATKEGVISIEFNADGSRAITGMSSNGQVILWDMLSRSEIRRYSFTNYGSYLPVAFGPDGQTIISSGPVGLIEMGVETGNFIQSFSGLSSVPTGLAISPDGKYIAASSMDGSIVLWDYSSGEELHRLDTRLELHSVLFTSDGGTIYAPSTEGKLIVWNINEKSLSDLLDWIQINRYVRDLTCLERQQYHVDP